MRTPTVKNLPHCGRFASLLAATATTLVLLAGIEIAQAQTTTLRIESAGAHAGSEHSYGYHRIRVGTNEVAFGTGGPGLHRGWAVATLDPAQPAPDAFVRLFDPWGDESEAQRLADYLESLPLRTLVLIAVCDEAGLNQWDVCDPKQSGPVQSLLVALDRLGSRKVRDYCYRDSFALAAVTGDGSALVEGLGKFMPVILDFDVRFGEGPPVIVTQPRSQSAIAGTTINLSATALSASRLSVQWRRDGAPILGATNFILTLPAVSDTDVGFYSAEFSNATGSMVSSNAEVAVVGYPRPGTLDQSFQLGGGFPGSCEIHQAVPDGQDWVVSLTMGYWPHSVPGFSRYSGGYGPDTALIITRLTAGGQEDPTFSRFTSTGIAYALAIDSLRRVYVATGNKRQLSGLTRLLPNGAKDTNFVVSIDWAGTSPEYGAWINALAIDSLGRIIIGGHFSSVNGQVRWGLARLLGDGTLDVSFNPGFLRGTVATLNLLDHDRVLVVSGPPPTTGGNDEAIVLPSGDPAHFFIVNADGSLDLTLDGGLGFTMPRYWGHGRVKATYVLPNGFALVGKGIKVVGDGIRYDAVLLNSAGRATRGFVFPRCYASAVQSDGRVLLAGVTTNSVVRLNPDGTFDTVFALPGAPNGLVSLLATGPDDRVLMGGMFSEVGDVPSRGFARIFGTTGRMPAAPRIVAWGVDTTGFLATFQTERFYEYSLEASDSPAGPWAKRSVVAGDGSVKQIADPVTAAIQFYRLSVR